MKRWALISATALSLIVACNGGDDADSDTAPGARPAPSGPITTIEELLQENQRRFCHSLFNCMIALPAFLSAFGDESSCADNTLLRQIEREFGARREALIQLEAAGRVRVDPDAAAACFERIGECRSFLFAHFVECPGMIEGTQEAGEACTLHEECKGDSYCRFEARACPGTCAPRQALGSICDPAGDPCTGGAEASVCRRDSPAADSEGHCVARRLVYADGEGAACGLEPNQEIFGFVQCPAGLFCDFTSSDSSTGTCRQPLAIGAPCDTRSDFCETDALCAGTQATGSCRRFEWLPEGAACAPDGLSSQAAACDLREQLVCVDGRCEVNRSGTAGSRCDEEFELATCAEGFHCAGTTCVALQVAGGPCTAGDECESGACATDRTCREQYCDAGYF